MFLAVLLTLAILVWSALRWGTRTRVVTGVVATLCGPCLMGRPHTDRAHDRQAAHYEKGYPNEN